MIGKIKSILYRLRGEVCTEDLIRLGLKVGTNFRRNEHCIIDQSHCWLIKIGNNVTLAPRVHILAHDASMWYECGYTKIAPVTIGNNVFIGAGSIIMPGVTIGNNVVVGAGSVVTHDIESDSVVVGNPAKKVKTYQKFVDEHKKAISTFPCFDESYTLRNKKITKDQKNEMKIKLEESNIGYVE